MRHRNAPVRRLHSAREGQGLDWTPMEMPGLTAWFRGEDVVLNGSTVSRWNDKSGNGRHLSQSTAANQPTWVAADAGLNGCGALDFDGTNDVLGTVVAISNFITATQSTVFAVFIADAIDSSTADATAYQNDAVWTDSGGWIGLHLHNAPKVQAWGNTVVSTPLSIGSAVSVIHRHNGTAAGVKVNGNAEVTAVGAGTIGNVSGSLRAGRAWDGSTNYFDGRIAEIVFSNQDATTSYASWLAYINKRYGL